MPHLSATDGLPSPAPVRRWLFVLAGLVALMVAVGGATRLTGSGLSITEWRPVTGALPPLSAAAWDEAFALYRASPQYRLLNDGMALGDFQFIYWWEWSHRQLGRLVGLVFLVPLVWFWARARIRSRFALGLLAIGALGGLQGTIGWIMVASGLEPGMTAVAPVKLMLHLMGAALILALLVSVAAGIGRPARAGEGEAARSAAGLAALTVALIALQVALGALVAGSKAGLTYNTWPLMDGRVVPGGETLFVVRPWWENFVDNPALVQLDHRLVGYAVVALALAAAWQASRRSPGSAVARRARALAGIALAQVALGVATLLLVVPLPLALAHQLLAMALLAMACVHLRLCRLDRTPARRARAVAAGPSRAAYAA